MLRLIKVSLLLFIAISFVIFAVANRLPVTITFFPLPISIHLPIFVFAILCIVFGMLITWLVLALEQSRIKQSYRNEFKRANAFENEIKTLRAEQESALVPKDSL